MKERRRGSCAPPRPERPVSAARSRGTVGWGRRVGRAAVAREARRTRARRCPGLICRNCGSGGGDRRVGRGRAARQDRVIVAAGGWAGGIGEGRRGARTPSPVEAGPPRARRRRGCLVLRTGAELLEALVRKLTSSRAPPARSRRSPSPCRRPLASSSLPASPFARRAPLSAAGWLKSAGTRAVPPMGLDSDFCARAARPPQALRAGSSGRRSPAGPGRVPRGAVGE